jgi:TRAP-type mannitol/chloroaromatic compound transport system permease small subunit
MFPLLLLSRRIDAVNEWIGHVIGWAIPLAVVISASHAFARYLFSDTGNNLLDEIFNQRANAWFEIQWYLFSAVFLLGASYTLRRNEHVRIDVVAGRFSRRTQAWIDVFGFLLFLLPMTAVFIYYGWPYALLSMQSQEINNVGGLVTWPAKALIVAGFFLLALQGISELIKRIGFLAGRLDASVLERRLPHSPHDTPSAGASSLPPSTGMKE